MHGLVFRVLSVGILLALAPAALAQKPGAAGRKSPSSATASAGKPSDRVAQSPSGKADEGGEKKPSTPRHAGATDRGGALDALATRIRVPHGAGKRRDHPP